MDSIKKKIDVVVVGELNVDIILNQIEGFPSIGKEIIADSMAVTLGSSSAIFASNLSTLGANVAFIGKVGIDNFADVVISSLENKKVNTKQIIRSETLATGATIVLNYDQDRAMITYPGAMNDLQLKDIDFDFLSTARHMHFSSCFLQPGIRNDLGLLFRKAKEAGLTTSFDAQWDPEEKWDLPLEKILPFVDVFLPNKQEFLFLTSSDSIEEGIDKIKFFANNVIIKNSSDGAIGWNGKELISQKAFLNNNVVDCIGAGDSFNSGFIKEFVDKKPFNKCLEMAALTGALNTTKAGGTGAFESIEIIRDLAKSKFNYVL